MTDSGHLRQRPRIWIFNQIPRLSTAPERQSLQSLSTRASGSRGREKADWGIWPCGAGQGTGREDPALALSEKEVPGVLEVGRLPPNLSFLVEMKACATTMKMRFYLDTRECTAAVLQTVESWTDLFTARCWAGSGGKRQEMWMCLASGRVKVAPRPTYLMADYLL